AEGLHPHRQRKNVPDQSRINGVSSCGSPARLSGPTDTFWNLKQSRVTVSEIRKPSAIDVLALFTVVHHGPLGAWEISTRRPGESVPYALSTKRSMSRTLWSVIIGSGFSAPVITFRATALPVMGSAPWTLNS